MSHTRNVLLVALVALCVGVLGARTVLSQDPPVPVRAGFIDLSRAFQSYRKVTDIETDAKAQFDSIASSVRAERSELEGLQEEMQTLNPGTEEFEVRQRTIDIRIYSLKRDEEYARKRLLRRTERMHALVYKEICDEAQAYGEELGLGTVLSYAPLREGFERNVDLEKLLTSRTVLWSDEGLDITDAVVERLNALLPPPSAGPDSIPIEDEPEDDNE